MIFGYASVSTPDQNISAQTDFLKEHGSEKIYTDVESGVREDRRGLSELLSYLRGGYMSWSIERKIFRSLIALF